MKKEKKLVSYMNIIQKKMVLKNIFKKFNENLEENEKEIELENINNIEEDINAQMIMIQ